jgi:hypothetical protein
MALHNMRRLTAKLTKRTLGQEGAAMAGLMQQWPLIAGAKLSKLCWPTRLVRGRKGMHGTLTLHVRTAGAVQIGAAQDMLVQRINAHYGFAAVSRLKLVQAPLPTVQQRPRLGRPHQPPSHQVARRAKTLSHVQDDNMRQALAELAEAIEAKQKRKR